MINKLEINDDVIITNWTDEQDRNYMREKLNTLVEEFNIPVYFKGSEHFLYCFDGYEHITSTPLSIDYGYGLTFKSLEKYLKDKYGDGNKGEYFIVAYTMSMDYEKYYKNGTFVDLNGKNTGEDFWYQKNADDLAKKADIENYWIAYCVYDLTPLKTLKKIAHS